MIARFIIINPTSHYNSSKKKIHTTMKVTHWVFKFSVYDSINKNLSLFLYKEPFKVKH